MTTRAPAVLKTLEDHLKQEQESKAPNWSNLLPCQPLSRVRVNLWSKMAKPSWQFENLSQLCFVPKFPPIFHLLGICPRPIRCIRVHYPGNVLLVLPSSNTHIFLQIQQMNGRSTSLDNSFYHNHYDLKWTKQVSAPSNLKDYFKTDCRHRNCHTTQIRFVVCVSYMTDIAAVDLYLRLIMTNILLLLFCSAAWVGYTSPTGKY